MSAPALHQERAIDIGDVVDGYELIARIAAGGMANVFLGRRRRAGGFEKRVAIKVMHPHLRDEPGFRAMFLDEARIASRISHPNVVQILDVGEHRGSLWMSMELIDGRPLHHLVADDRCALKAPLGLRIAALAQAAEGLAAAHDAVGEDGRALGVIHRDVSPHNILVGLDGRVKVIDFGVAAARGRIAHTETGAVKGKWGYIAPEQIGTASAALDRRVDVWSFGVTAWELLTEERLFPGSDPAARAHGVLYGPIPLLAEVAPDVPPEVAKLIHRCLVRTREARLPDLRAAARVLYASAEALSSHRETDLAEHMRRAFPPVAVALPEDSPATATLEEPTSETRSIARSRRWPLWGALLIVAVAGVGLWFGRGLLAPAVAAPATVVAQPASAPTAPQSVSVDAPVALRVAASDAPVAAQVARSDAPVAAQVARSDAPVAAQVGSDAPAARAHAPRPRAHARHAAPQPRAVRAPEPEAASPHGPAREDALFDSPYRH